MRTIAVLSLVSSLLVPTAVGAWQDRIDGVEPNDEFARHVVIDAAGDVISAGTLAGRPSIAPSGGDLVVVKHAGATGSELWRTLVVGAEHGGEVGGLALVTNGDAIVAGAIDRTLLTRADFAVTRHAAATGAELWHATYGGPDPYSNDFAEAVAVDAAADVVAAGAIQTASRTDMLVVKLDGTDGSELREFLTCGVLARGFARVRYGDCAFERLVPLSCKGPGSEPAPAIGPRRQTW